LTCHDEKNQRKKLNFNEPIPERLTFKWFENHARIKLVGAGTQWVVMGWRNIIFLRLSKKWIPDEIDAYVNRLSALSGFLSKKADKIFLIFDLSRMRLKKKDTFRYLRANWFEFLANDDVQVCIVDEGNLRRIILRSLYRIVGQLEKFKIFRDCDRAFAWVREEIISSKNRANKKGGDMLMTESEKVRNAQDFINRELQKKGAGRIDAIDWEQTLQGRATRTHRVVIIQGGEKSIFTFTEYKLLKDYGSKEWEIQLRQHVGDILMELEMSGRIGETLVRIGAIKPHQVDDILLAQKDGDSRLFGEIAIEFGYINDEVLKKYVEAKAVWGKEA
jgi:hypothetical protein